MTDNAPAAGAPDEALRAEVGKIMADPNWGRDPALQAKVAQMYRDRYGDKQVTIGEGIVVTGAPRAPGQPPEGAETVSPEDREADRRAATQLQGEWGGEYDARMETARSGLEDVSGRLGIAADDLIGAYLEAGGDRAVGIKTLEIYGRSRRGGA